MSDPTSAGSPDSAVAQRRGRWASRAWGARGVRRRGPRMRLQLPDNSTTGSRGLMAVLLTVAVCVVALDQATKQLALSQLAPNKPVEVIGEVLQLRLLRNAGAAFGLGSGFTLIFPVIALIVVVVIIRSASRLVSTPWAWGLGLLLGGACGNLIDRLFRTPGFMRGHVVDFLELPRWPVFNVADMAIVAAAVLIGILSLLGRSLDEKREVATVEVVDPAAAGRGDSGTTASGDLGPNEPRPRA